MCRYAVLCDGSAYMIPGWIALTRNPILGSIELSRPEQGVKLLHILHFVEMEVPPQILWGSREATFLVRLLGWLQSRSMCWCSLDRVSLDISRSGAINHFLEMKIPPQILWGSREATFLVRSLGWLHVRSICWCSLDRVSLDISRSGAINGDRILALSG
jgi:hypothetical protein